MHRIHDSVQFNIIESLNGYLHLSFAEFDLIFRDANYMLSEPLNKCVY